MTPPQTDASFDGLVTTSQSARILGVTPTRVRQLVIAGALQPALVTPFGRLYGRDHLEALVAVRRASKAPPRSNSGVSRTGS